MSDKHNVSKQMYPLWVLMALFFVTGIFLFLTLNYVLNKAYLEAYGNLIHTVDRLKIPTILLVLEIVIMLFLLCIGLIKTRKALHTSAAIQFERQKTIGYQQIELEKQNKLIHQLSKLYNEAIDYDRMKTEFFANTSHDLKTPLSVILGAIQLIDQSIPQSSDRRRSGRHLKTVRQNCYRLIRLVNNILDITKMDSGFVKSNFINCNIIYLVEEITQSVVPFAQQKGLILEFDTDSEEVLTGVDIEKFERIILNLLSNAIKFTPAGGKVSVHMSTRNEKVFISVKDTGVGIPAEMQPLIFERFKQVNSSLTKNFEGTGIGLSLVKSFVEMHQGSIHLNSGVNQGSEFILEIPINPAEVQTVDASETENRQSKMIEAIHIEFSDIYTVAS